jgi:hypothetical protein
MPGSENQFVDFMEAIEAHVRWKVRLEALLAGTSEEELDADAVGRDDLCVLGKWIYGPGGEAHGDNPKFVALRRIHAEFHQSAGEVVRCAARGEHDHAREILNRGEYAKASHRIKAELARLALGLARE